MPMTTAELGVEGFNFEALEREHAKVWTKRPDRPSRRCPVFVCNVLPFLRARPQAFRILFSIRLSAASAIMHRTVSSECIFQRFYVLVDVYGLHSSGPESLSSDSARLFFLWFGRTLPRLLR